MSRIFLIIIFTFLINSGDNLLAQSEQEKYLIENIETHRFDDDKYKELTDGVDFSEEAFQPKKKKEKEEEEGTPPNFEGIGALLKFLVIILGVGLLIFLLVRTLGNESLFSPRDKKLKPVANTDLEKIEDNLEEAELDDPIRQAIAAGDYPLAVRLYYLAVLKDLSLSKKIKWKKDKTNGEYLRELSGTSIFIEMQKITLVFERIWYGKMELNKEDFLIVEELFLKMIPANSAGVKTRIK